MSRGCHERHRVHHNHPSFTVDTVVGTSSTETDRIRSGPAGRARSDRVEGRCEVVDQVGGVLDADRQPDQVVGDLER